MQATEQQFIPGSEAFLAAVLYVARDAQQQWEIQQRRRAKPLSPWWYLNKVRRALGLEEQALSYSAMRAELINFAETFGVVGATPNARVNTDAASAFDDIEE